MDTIITPIGNYNCITVSILKLQMGYRSWYETLRLKITNQTAWTPKRNSQKMVITSKEG